MTSKETNNLGPILAVLSTAVLTIALFEGLRAYGNVTNATLGISPHWYLFFLAATSGAIVCFFGTLLSLFLHYRRQRQYLNSGKRRVKELVALHHSLNSYLNSFDERSRKYFHCTSQKTVKTYFTLRNICTSLEHFLSDAKPALNERSSISRDSSAALSLVLSGSLEFQNNVFSTRCSHAGISFALLAKEVAELRATLDDSVKGIEAEIAAAASRTTA